VRIIFCGTPEYAAPSLARLASLVPRHEVVAVVSQPDKPKGRSGVPTPPPVVDAARKLGLPPAAILQPQSINEPETLQRLGALAADLLCVVAYGALLKKKALALPRLCALNAHGSLLPKYRGAAPIQAALLAGDKETGVSIMGMVRGLDKGPLLLQRAIPIQPNDNAATLHDRLAALSAECFAEAIARFEAGTAAFTPQDEAAASYAAKLEKDSGRMDWTKDAAFLERFVRAMNPWPGAWTTVSLPDGSQKLRVRVSRAGFRGHDPISGCLEIGIVSPESRLGVGLADGSGTDAAILVGCGDGGTVAVREVQPEGKRAMSTAEFLRGAGRRFAADSHWE